MIIFALLILAFVVAIGGGIYILARAKMRGLRPALGIVLALDIVAAWFMTFRFTYSWNENTIAHGWPIPRIIMQRDAPGEPWMDFIGWTLVLAYPINFILLSSPFIFLLSLIVFVTNRRGAQPGGGPNPVPPHSTG